MLERTNSCRCRTTKGRMAVMARTWTVGVDAGGTWVRARATDDRGKRRRARVRATASEELGLTLDRIWRRWRMRGSDVARLVVASRGGWTPAERRLAALGPRVIRLARSGNVTARLVVGAEAAALAWTLARVAGALRLEGETAASWAGSLMGDDYFRAQVWRWARRQGLRVTPRAPRESALDAAARLAAARGR